MYATIREGLIADGMLEGEANGKAEMLEPLLDARELALTDELCERVAGGKDESLLRRWFHRAQRRAEAPPARRSTPFSQLSWRLSMETE